MRAALKGCATSVAQILVAALRGLAISVAVVLVAHAFRPAGTGVVQ